MGKRCISARLGAGMADCRRSAVLWEDCVFLRDWDKPLLWVPLCLRISGSTSGIAVGCYGDISPHPYSGKIPPPLPRLARKVRIWVLGLVRSFCTGLFSQSSRGRRVCRSTVGKRVTRFVLKQVERFTVALGKPLCSELWRNTFNSSKSHKN